MGRKKHKQVEDTNGFFEVDETQLDREWVRQPSLYYDYAIQLADAKLTLEECKTELEVVRADFDLHIRSNPADYGIEKITEKVVEATVVQQEDHAKALKEVQSAKHEVDLLSAAVQALDQKKHALQNLVSLHGQSYYATPRADEAGREVADDLNKSASRRRRRRERSQ